MKSSQGHNNYHFSQTTSLLKVNTNITNFYETNHRPVWCKSLAFVIVVNTKDLSTENTNCF